MIAAELRAFLRVTDERGLRRLIGRVRQACLLELGEATAERYWKDPGLQQVCFSVAVPQGSTGDMVFEALQAAWSLGGPWWVSSSGQPGTPGWEFVAIANQDSSRFTVPGMEWAELSLRSPTPQ